MSSLAKDLQITFVGLTPNPVNVMGAYLVSIGVAEVDRVWLDWASTIWANVASLKWGA
jgi:hypothetical protein